MRRVKPRRLLAGSVGFGLGALLVLSLREATLSTHHYTEPGSRTEVIVEGRAKGAEPGQTVAEMVEAALRTCRLEVNSDLLGPIVGVGRGRFRAVLTPAMDETNRRQLRGCLDDWAIDHFQADVVSLTDLG